MMHNKHRTIVMNRDEHHSKTIEIRSIFGYSKKKNIVLIIVYDDAQWETFYILNKIHHMLPVIRSCFSLLQLAFIRYIVSTIFILKFLCYYGC